MKAALALAFLSFLLPFAAQAEEVASDREALIEQAEKAQSDNQHNTLTADSPLINQILNLAHNANPNVSPDKWNAVKSDLAAEFTKSFFEKGSAFDLNFRAGVEGLSDAELAHLVDIYNDPVYVKLQNAQHSAAYQQQLMKNNAANMMKMQITLAVVLTRNGLNVPH